MSVSEWRGRDLRLGHHIAGDAPNFMKSDLRGVLLSQYNPYDRASNWVEIRSGGHGSTFAMADLREAEISGTWGMASFARANCAKTRWHDVHAKDCWFDAAHLVESEFLGLHFQQCSFGGTDLSRSRFVNVVFDTCALRGARLRRTVNPQLAASQDPTPLVFQQSDLSGADLGGLVSENLALRECTAEGCNFSGARLARSSFHKSALRHAVFDRARLKGASFRAADLRWSSFVNADLSGADLSGADLSGADLTGARFEDIVLAWAICEGVRGVEAGRLARIRALAS